MQSECARTHTHTLMIAEAEHTSDLYPKNVTDCTILIAILANDFLKKSAPLTLVFSLVFDQELGVMNGDAWFQAL